ncbi:hypothetical protein J2Z37_002399 [Ammoniphilus resinae]|uniref:Uncharacterized protein n=1 Tax=Ammoniphilus resinae TaxID=861532 RepID=A0ABS4GQ51_9BACL|nr:hypothetical protein [Ammoniphilus resinae]
MWIKEKGRMPFFCYAKTIVDNSTQKLYGINIELLKGILEEC